MNELIQTKKATGGHALRPLADVINYVPLFKFKTTAGSWQDALISAAASGESGIQLPAGTITVDTPISVSGRSQFFLKGAGRTFSQISTPSNINVFTFDGIEQGHISDFAIIGTGSVGKGMVLTNNKWLSIDNVFAKQLSYGIQATSAGNEALYVPNLLNNIQVFQCQTGISLEGTAEYFTIQNPRIFNCSINGIYMSAGNNKIVGGTVCQNVNGITIDGDSANNVINSDHGGIYSTSVNHNQMVGIAVRNTRYSFSIVGVQVWATIGPNGVKGNYDSYGTNFGVFLRNCKNIELSGMIAHNRVNIGIDGLITSNIDARLKSSPSETEFQIKDYGTSTNAQNAINITTDGTLLNGETRGYACFTNTQSQANRISNFSSLTPRVQVLTGASPATYVHTGDTAHFHLKSDYTGSVSIAPVLRQQIVKFSVEQVAALQTVNLTVTGASALTSTTALAKVSGQVITLMASGDYELHPTGPDSYVVHSNAKRTLPVTPTFVNSWGALGSTIEQPVFWLNADGTVEAHGLITGGAANSVPFGFPANYRPLKETFRSVNASEAFGAVQISPNGNLQVKVIQTGNWVSLNGIRFPAF